jgi:hypothetical protein
MKENEPNIFSLNLCVAVQVAAPAEDESDGAGPMRGYYSNAGEYTAEKLSALRIGQSNVAQVPDASTARAATFIPDANQIHDARKRRVCGLVGGRTHPSWCELYLRGVMRFCTEF